MADIFPYFLAKGYTEQSLTGAGALKGEKGDIGPQGPEGPQGDVGPAGANGVGVPSGGTAGQVLAKKSDGDYDTKWVDQTWDGGTGGGTGNVSSAEITTIKVLDRAEYDALPAKDAKTVYLIRG